MSTEIATGTTTTGTTTARATPTGDRLLGRKGAVLLSVVATVLAVLLPAGSASAREASSKSKDGCTFSVSRPIAISTWQRQVRSTITCSSARTVHYGSNAVMTDISGGADRVAASSGWNPWSLRAGVTYTVTSTWSTGSTNGYGQYGRAVVKLGNWSAALVVESATVDGVYY